MSLGSKHFVTSSLENVSVARQESDHIFIHLKSSLYLHKGVAGLAGNFGSPL